MKIINIAMLLLFLIGANVAHSKELLPIDEGERDPSFKKFRNDLLHAISRKDQQYLLSVLALNIINNFGGDGGEKEFSQQWELGSKKTKIWKELKWVLTHGGSFDADGSFCAPYVYSSWPKEDEYDSFEYAAVVAEDVPLRKTRAMDSAVVTRLKYSIVYVLDSPPWEDNRSIKVKVGEETGFVLGQDIRSSIDYRACFEKQKDKWVMTSFVAGD